MGHVFPILCGHIFFPTFILPSPVLKAKATDFLLAKFLITLSETCSTIMRWVNSRGLCAYCQANQGGLLL